MSVLMSAPEGADMNAEARAGEGNVDVRDLQQIDRLQGPHARPRYAGGRGRRNERKALILRTLGHFWVTALTPRDITLWIWEAMTPAERAQTSFPVEWRRNALACRELARPWRVDKATRLKYRVAPYIGVRRLTGKGRPVAYVLLKKGDRVRRKIAGGSLPGRSALFHRLPGRRRAVDASGAPPSTG